MFHDNSKDIILGYFDNDKLTAMSGLYFDLADFESYAESLKIDLRNTAEIGGCMTLAEYRGKGYMYKLVKKLKHIAEEIGVKYLVATVHPENEASLKTLKKLGMHVAANIKRNSYKRNLLLMKV